MILAIASIKGFGQTFTIKDLNKSAVLSGEYFEFTKPQKNISEAISNYQNKTHIQKLSKLKRKYKKEAAWYVFTIKSSFDKKIERVIQYPFGCTDEMEIFEVDSKLNLKKSYTRTHSTPLKKRNFRARRLSVQINVKPLEEKIIFAKLKSRHIVGMIFDIQNPQIAKDYEEKYKVISLIYTGVFIGLFFYNFFYGLTSKDKTAFYYLGMLTSISFLILIVADVPAYFNITVSYFFHKSLSIHHALMIIFSCLFAISFLNTKNNFKKIHLSFVVMASLAVIVAILSIFDPLYSISNQILKNLMTLMLVISIINAGYISFKTRQRPAIIYLLAIGALFTSGLMYLLTWNYGLFERSFFTANIILLGSAIEMILFSIALADNFNLKIKNELNKRLLAENSLKDLNVDLEIKVKSKTKELLSIKRRAALGEMAVSVAHEINSPLSAVFNNNQRIVKLLSKENTEREKLLRTSKKIETLLEGIFDITKNLQLYGDDFNKYELKEYDLVQVLQKAIEKVKLLGKEVELVNISFDEFQVLCKETPLVNSFVTLIKYLLLNSSDIIINKKQADSFIYIDFNSRGKKLPTWIKSYLSESFSSQTGEVKGSGLELSIVKDTFDSLGIEIEIGDEEDDFKFRLKLPNSMKVIK